MTIAEKKRRIIESVVLLASDVDRQQAALPDWVARADEIALIFDECYQFVRELGQQEQLTVKEIEALQSLDQKLASMSGPSQAALWTEEALATDANWQWIRQRAQEALELLGAELHAPKLDWVTFVR